MSRFAVSEGCYGERRKEPGFKTLSWNWAYIKIRVILRFLDLFHDGFKIIRGGDGSRGYPGPTGHRRRKLLGPWLHKHLPMGSEFQFSERRKSENGVWMGYWEVPDWVQMWLGWRGPRSTMRAG